MAIMKIIKKSIVPLIKGAICNTKNILNKEENTYSAKIIDEDNEVLSNRIVELENKTKQQVLYENETGERDINIGTVKGLLMIVTEVGTGFCLASDSSTDVTTMLLNGTGLMLRVDINNTLGTVRAWQLDSSGSISSYPLIKKIIKI